MKRLVLLLGAALAMSAGAASPLRADTSTPPKLDVFVYVDTVNGTRPAGAKARPVGCTQSNIFTRGEQAVFRTWGSEAATGDILSTENVKYAYVKIPGQPNIKLNWGAHGNTGAKVWFWTAAWNIPADYPLGTITARVVFKTEANHFGLVDYDVTVNPLPSASH